MNIITLLIICPLNFLAGFVDSIGGGGGMISLPGFLLAGFAPHAALATNKLASTIGTSVSTARYCRNGYFDRKLAIPGILLALCGSTIGSHLALLTSDVLLKKTMLVLLPIVAISVLTSKKEDVHDDSLPFVHRIIIVCISAFLLGTYDGFYGPGTGTFLLIALTRFARLDIRTASGNVKLINLASNVAALFTFLQSGNVIIHYGLICAVFSLTGHYIGSGLVMKNGTKIVRPITIVVLVLLFVKVLSGN